VVFPVAIMMLLVLIILYMAVWLLWLFWLKQILGISHQLLCNTVSKASEHFVKEASTLGYCLETEHCLNFKISNKKIFCLQVYIRDSMV
jgi:hypothetical protein